MITVVVIGLLVLVVWLLLRGFLLVVAAALAFALVYGTLPLDPLAFLTPHLRRIAINAAPEVQVVPREPPPGEPLDLSPVFPEPRAVPPPWSREDRRHPGVPWCLTDTR
jgi:hypothetical protein